MPTAKPMSSELKRYSGNLSTAGRKRVLRPLLSLALESWPSLPFEISLRLDLDQHLGRDQSAYLDHRSCRANVAEELPVGLADYLPFRDVRHEDASADDIFHAGACFLESTLNVLQSLHGWAVGVSYPYDLAVRPGRCGARDVDIGPNLHCTRVTHSRFPRCIARDVHSCHWLDPLRRSFYALPKCCN